MQEAKSSISMIPGFHVALLFLILVSRTRSDSTLCDMQYCQCAKESGIFVTAKCSIKRFEDLKKYITTPSRVSTLDISSNRITKVPRFAFDGFDNLVNLSLANNDIKALGNQSLMGLSSLLYLNLSDNKIETWNGNLTAQTPKLIEIDVTNNNHWLPSNGILEHKTLQVIRGVSWSKSCTKCTLVRSEKDPDACAEMQKFKVGEFYQGREGECRAIKYVFSGPLRDFARSGFYSSCFEVDKKCYSTLVELIPIHHCWDVDNYVLNIEFLIAPIALTLNLLVVVITLLTPKLRKNVAMILVCNIAISDSCLSVYFFLITSARKMSYVKFYHVIKHVCPVLGFLWLMSQCVTVMTLVLLTIERYLAIVYCMSPAVRMRVKMATKCAVSTWVIAVLVAILPVCGIGVYTANTYCIPLHRRKDIPHMYGFSVGLGVAGVLLYFITVPLYIRIYLFVRRSDMRGLNRADHSVARKIAVMVGCNMSFFCFPVVIVLLWVSFHFTRGLNPIVKEIIIGVIPTIGISVNCLINPLLYAYRNKSFINALRERLELLRTKARAWSLSNSSPVHQTASVDTLADKKIKSIENAV